MRPLPSSLSTDHKVSVTESRKTFDRSPDLALNQHQPFSGRGCIGKTAINRADAVLL
jgi:hypothetical protein